MSCNTAMKTRRIMHINYVSTQFACLKTHMRNVFMFGQWEMTEIIIWQLKEEHIDCVCHWHNNQYVIPNYIIPVYSLYMIFHVKSNDSFKIPLFLQRCTQRGWSYCICFHFLLSELPVLLLCPTEIPFMHKQTNFARFVRLRWGIS